MVASTTGRFLTPSPPIVTSGREGLGSRVVSGKGLTRLWPSWKAARNRPAGIRQRLRSVKSSACLMGIENITVQSAKVHKKYATPAAKRTKLIPAIHLTDLLRDFQSFERLSRLI